MADATDGINKDNYRTASLDVWQASFWRLYGEKHSSSSLYDVLLQTVADATRLAEAVRKQRPADALPYIPRILSWLLNIVTKCSRTPAEFGDLIVTPKLSDLVWHKYPNVCSLCLHNACMCSVLEITWADRQVDAVYAASLKKARSLADDRPQALDEWAAMFERIYGIPHARMPLADKTLHFFEEVGELEVELRKADRVRANIIPPGRADEYASIEFANEIADVFSWLISIFSHIAHELQRADRFMEVFLTKRGTPVTGKRSSLTPPTFSEWVWIEFGGPDTDELRCHRCRATKCVCGTEIRRR